VSASGPPEVPTRRASRPNALGTIPQLQETVAVPRIELVVEQEDGQPSNRVVVQDGEVCRVGSHPSNHLVIADPLVSRFHCRLSLDRGVWKLYDEGSLNGTRIAGVRVRDADLPVPDCRIELGRTVVRVLVGATGGTEEVPVWPSFGALYGTTLPMRRLFALLDRVAKSESNVLVEGESGTGKELIATEIVQRGPRSEKPLVVVDCGAISPNLFESELFGHARGAFTGADRDRVGAFEAADGGTVFLDEIGELPLEMQPKLLRALEAREIRRVGETRSRKVDVRVIAATNRRLEREVNHGRFREDLFFRLSVVTVHVPPLREHLEDLRLLVQVFLRQLGSPEADWLFTPEVLAEMGRYDWPGNVRELRNYVERAVVLQSASPASARDPSLGAPSHRTSGSDVAVDLDVPFKNAKESVIEAFERSYLMALLSWSGGNISKAARKAGLDRMYLHRLVQRHGLKGG
jgi:transcriptional regulator with GAF, ATPase, and Fis domain